MTEIYTAELSREHQRAAEKSDPRLHTNPVLQELILLISRTKPNPDEIKKVSEECGLTEDTLEKDRKNGKNLSGKLAEFHTFSVLSSLTEHFREIDLSPIPDGARAGAFTFEQNGINYRIRDNNGLHSLEYDILSEINSLPVIWEIKLNGTIKPISKERIDKIIAPLREYYRTRTSKFGYVLVRPSTSRQIIEIEQQFIGRGGIIVNFPCTKSEFRKEAYGEEN